MQQKLFHRTLLTTVAGLLSLTIIVSNAVASNAFNGRPGKGNSNSAKPSPSPTVPPPPPPTPSPSPIATGPCADIDISSFTVKNCRDLAVTATQPASVEERMTGYRNYCSAVISCYLAAQTH